MEKLAKIQQELHAPKDQRNDYGGYNYRSAESILEAVKPLLDGAVILMNDEIVNVGDRYYVRATVMFMDGDFSASATAFAREDEALKGMTQGQVTGAASSYARKYALNALFAIDNTKDLDSIENPDDSKVAAKFEPLTDAQKWRLQQYDVAAIFRELGVQSFDEVSKTMAATLINRLVKEEEARKTKYGD